MQNENGKSSLNITLPAGKYHQSSHEEDHGKNKE